MALIEQGAPDLGRVDVDPHVLEPGTMIAGRFCVLGSAASQGDYWRIVVTDVTRALGKAPHHRLELYHLPARGPERDRIQQAVLVDDIAQPVPSALLSTPRGVIIVAERPEGALLRGWPRGAAAMALARAFVGLLLKLHRAGVTGVRFDQSEMVQQGDGFRLDGFHHLVPRGVSAGEASADVQALVRLFESVGAAGLGALLSPPPADLSELSLRLHPRPKTTLRFSDVLPAEAPFVGRQEVFRPLLRALARARLAQPSMFVLRGPRGVGKSRVLRQLDEDLSRGGQALVLSGEGLRGTGLSQGAIAQALDRLIGDASLPGAERDAVRARMLRTTEPLSGILARLAPRMGAWTRPASEVPVIEVAEDFARHAAVVSEALASIGTQRRPLVLLIDNLADVDAGSVAVLRSLMGQDLAHHHTLVVAAAGDEVPADLQDRATVIDVEPLTTGEVEELVGKALPGPVDDRARLAASLQRAAEGLPLGVWTGLQQWVEEGRVRRASATATWSLSDEAAGTRPVADLFRYRFDRIGDDGRLVALVAAVRGGPVSIGWLVQVCHWRSARARDALDQLRRRGLMRGELSGELSFAHGTVRELVLDRTDAGAQAAAHGRIARWLGGHVAFATPTQPAFHQEHARPPGKDEALAGFHLSAGRQQLAVFDLERAGWHFERCLERGEGRDLRVGALEGRADVAALRHDSDRAVAAYIEAMETADSPEARARVAAHGTYALVRRCGSDAARRVAAHGLALVGAPLPRGRVGQALALARAGLAVLLRIPHHGSAGLRDALCELYTYLIPVLVTSPLLLLIAVLRGVRAARHLSSGAAATCVSYWAACWAAMGSRVRATSIFDRAESQALRASAPWSVGHVRHMRGHTFELPCGDYASGQGTLDAAVQGFGRTGDLSVAALSLFFKAYYGKDREEATTLLGWLDEAQAAARRHHNHLGEFPIRALHLLVEARQAKPRTLWRLVTFAAELHQGRDAMILPDVVMSRACVAKAFHWLGEADRAWFEIDAVLPILKSGPVIESFLDVYEVGAHLLLDRSHRAPQDLRLLRKLRRRLRRAARRSVRLRVAHGLLEARIEAQAGQVHAAAARLSGIIATRGDHGETLAVAQAHRLLAGFHADASAASGHLGEARLIGEALQIRWPGDEAPVEPMDDRDPADVSPDEGEPGVRGLMARLGPGLEAALGARTALEVTVDPDAPEPDPAGDLDSLIVHLVLSGRDARPGAGRAALGLSRRVLDEAGAARLGPVRPGPHLCVELVLTGGDRSGPSAELRGADQAALALGGVLEVSAGAGALRLRAWVPCPSDSRPPPGAGLGVLVLHSDARVRNTLLAALSRLGVRCRALVPGQALPGPWPVAFVEVGLDPPPELPAGAHLVGLVRRGAPEETEGPVLRVPFTVTQLEALLAPLRAEASGGAGPRE